MPRPCSYCNKLASLESEAEEPEVTVEQDGSVTASIRVIRRSACCGDEMKDFTFDLAGAIEDDVGEPSKGGPCVDSGDAPGHSWMEEAIGDVDVGEDIQRTDRNGKPIKSSRYMKTLITVSLDVMAKCEICGAEGTAILTGTAAAGEFEEI